MSDYVPGYELPIEVIQQQERARRQSEREAEERKRLYERDQKAKEAEQRREAEEAAKREAQIIAEREEAARKEAAETKALERERYIAAGGSPDDFEADYPAIRQRLMAERMLAAERVAAHPRHYMHGLSGGTTKPVGPTVGPTTNTTDNGGTH